jgi:S1-C subfamily serine protease
MRTLGIAAFATTIGACLTVVTAVLAQGGALPLPESTPGPLGASASGAGTSSERTELPDGIELRPGRTAAYASALSSVRPDARGQVRGAKEVQLYRAASPAVVLVVSESGLGSGALISAGGDIVTNWHVISGQREVGVIFKPQVEGKDITKADVRRAVVVKSDEVADLALLRVLEVPQDVTPLQFGLFSDVSVGADVHAIGHPTGQAWTYTKGVVSQIRQNYKWTSESKKAHQATVIQTQTPINPGNSGGPLLADDGRIIGINSFKSAGEGLNFAVAVPDLQRFLDSPGRTAATIPSRPRQTASAACTKGEPKELYSGPSGDGKETRTGFDMDCDGKPDFEFRVPNDRSAPVSVVFDENGDGKPDSLVLDFERDKKWDLSLHDTNFDGRWDLVGHHPNGDITATRYERYDVYMARTSGGRKG